jgi:methylenetetrahydrofolate dehydrogenase (NADP+)/methenyltetrahydrofolate cyclohydrolase
MSARILDGKETARAIQEELTGRVARLRERGVVPRLVVILVGDDPASRVYVGNKGKQARAIGIDAETREIPASVSQAELEALVDALARDASVHGILLQLPLPAELDAEPVVRRIPASKDVDGLTPESVGELARGTPRFVPCTPYGVVELLDRAGIELSGKHVVILGRSNLVGRPLASLLLLRGRRADATVTVCHSRSERIAEVVRTGDVVVAAIGRAGFVTRDMIRPGAVVVDVGINRIEDPSRSSGSRLVGDVDFVEVEKVASAITPVPGGVGPMTVAMLLVNTVQAAEQHARISGHDLAIR